MKFLNSTFYRQADRSVDLKYANKNVLIQTGTEIRSVTAGGYGGILYVKSPSTHTIELNSVTIDGLTATGDGAVYYPEEATSITFKVISSTIKSF